MPKVSINRAVARGVGYLRVGIVCGESRMTVEMWSAEWPLSGVNDGGGARA